VSRLVIGVMNMLYSVIWCLAVVLVLTVFLCAGAVSFAVLLVLIGVRAIVKMMI